MFPGWRDAKLSGTTLHLPERAGKQKRTPRERLEQQALIKAVKRRWWYPYLHHSPNEELNAIARQLASSMGTSPGFPDLMLFLRTERRVGLAIELKAPKPHGHGPSKEQKAWAARLTEQGWRAIVSFGWEPALVELDHHARLAREFQEKN